MNDDENDTIREFSTRTKWEPTEGDFLEGKVRYMKDGNYEIFDGLTLWFLYDMPSLTKVMKNVKIDDLVHITCIKDDEFEIIVK